MSSDMSDVGELPPARKSQVSPLSGDSDYNSTLPRAVVRPERVRPQEGSSSPSNRGISRPADNKTANDLLMKCSREVKEYYKNCSNVLRINLPPTTEEEIFSVNELHVPVSLQKTEISPDLPVITKIKAQHFFRGPNSTKKKILLYGPPGGGKTTEIKKWIHSWCFDKEDNPFPDFAVVFYIDTAQMNLGSSLGEAITSQCLPAESEFSATQMEALCRDRQNEILVILDNYTQCRKSDVDKYSSWLVRMVQLQDFVSLCLLVATTSAGVGDFRKIYGNYDHVRVDGISEFSVFKYVDNLFKNREDETFKLNVLEYIEATQLAPLMASSPVLLVILCQILKWHKVPTEIEDLKTTCAVTDRLMEHMCKLSSDAGGRERKLFEPRMTRAENEEDISPPPFRMTDNDSQDTISVKETLSRLSAVAFNCYLRRGLKVQLNDSEFDICGDLKSEVIDEGCRLKLLYKLCEEEINPSSEQAAKGRVYKFLSPVFQQKLAAKHFIGLLKGDEEDHMLFDTTLQQIRDASEALSLRNLFLFACGESIDAAYQIISHIVKLTKEEHPDGSKNDGVLKECEGWYQYLVEFILELNYEAQSEGQFNHILSPVVTSMRIVSPSVIMTRSLSYFLKHIAPAKGSHLDQIVIEVFDVNEKTGTTLPSLDHLRYTRSYIPVQVGEEDLGSQSAQPRSQNMYRLEIRVEQMKTTHGTQAPSAIAAVAPAINLDIPPGTQLPSTSGNGLPSNDALPRSLTISPEHYRDIPLVRHDEIEMHGHGPIADGGFGEVFKVTYRGKVYAMKRLKNVDEKSCYLAEREIKMNARIRHPNIVVLRAYAKYELGNTGTYRFELLMDFIDGCPLEKVIFSEEQKFKYLETRKGQIELALKVSDAIAHIHANKCIHADITPYNILIKRPENEPYLCDFGLAHAMAHSAHTSGTCGMRYGVRTRRWSAPECSAQGYRASISGDIWSLACTLLEVFTRREVWHDYNDDDWKLINRLKQDSVVPEILSFVKDQTIQDILGRCFTKDPDERPDAQQLVDTFKQALSSV